MVPSLSPFFASLLRISLFIAGAVVGARMLHMVADRLFGRRSEDSHTGRLATIHHVFVLVLRGGAVAIGGLMILSELGVNIAPILASVGVLGLALSFGAQTLVRDVIAGLFLVVEDQARVGENVKIGDVRGRIKTLKLRTLVLEGNDGAQHFIPYGDVKSLANFSRKV